MSGTFKDKLILITGAGTGIGKLMAQRLASQGAIVILTARRLNVVEAIASDIRSRQGRAHAYTLDVTDIGSIAPLRDQIRKDHGPIDMLVNNAGIVHGGAFEQVPLEQHLETVQVNLNGLMALTHAFLPDLKTRPCAHIINIASASGFISLPYGTSYAASKWAVVGFSDSLRLELKERGLNNVHITTVCPSYISTGMFDGVKTPWLSPMLTPEKLVKSVLHGIENKKSFVMAPYMVNWIEFGKGLMPRSVWEWFARLIGISTSMSTWYGKSGKE